MIKVRSILFCMVSIILIGAMHIGAQSPSLYFKSLSVKDGLSQANITTIVKDSIGFMWFGTYNGLNRYDGYEFKTYYHVESDTASLSHSLIRSLACDDDGYLWVGTPNGLNKFDPRNGRSTRLLYHSPSESDEEPMLVTSVLCHADNYVWVGSWGNGLIRIHSQSLEIVSLKQLVNEQLELPTHIVQISRATDNELWLTSRGGDVYLLNLNTYDLTSFNFPETIDPGYSSTIAAIDDQRAIVGTTDAGLFLLSKNNGVFQSLEQMLGKDFSPSTLDHYFFQVDDDGTIWLGTLGDGIYIIDPDLKSYQHVQSQWRRPYALNNNMISSFYKDKTGIIWVGTYDGLNYYDPYFKQIGGVTIDNINEEHQTTAMYASEQLTDSTMLLAVQGKALQTYDFKNHRFINTHTYLLSKEVNSDFILSLCKLRSGDLLIGSHDGLRVVNMKNGDVEFFGDYGEEGRALYNRYVRVIHESSNGIVWLGTGAGLERFDPENRDIELYAPFPELTDDHLENLVWAIEEDNAGNLWVGTDGGGLHLFNVQLNKFVKRFRKSDGDSKSLTSDRVISLLIDDRDNFWVGTAAGLNLLNRGSDKFHRLTKQDGLTSDVCFGLISDKNNQLWFSTSNRIVKFDVVSWTFEEYDYADGVQSKEFTTGNCLRLPDNQLFFGGLGGFNLFNPNKIKTNKRAPRVVITGLDFINLSKKVENEASENRRPVTDIAFADSLFLSYNTNSFVFKYAALGYSLSDQNKYEYLLEGFDKGWISGGTNRLATYTNVPPGDYLFKIRASNHDGVWSDTETTMHIFIKPPIWRTWWAYCFYILFLIASVWVFIIGRTKTLKAQKRQLEAKVSERTLKLREANELLEERQHEVMTQNEELANRQEEIMAQRDELEKQKQEIESQNIELEKNRTELEERVKDRTKQLLEAKEKAELSEKLKTAFLANVSHEIRTPMNAIVGFSSMLGDTDLDEESRQQFVDIIRRNSEDLLVIIGDVLELSRIESGEVIINIDDVDVYQLLDELYEEHKPRIASKGLRFICTKLWTDQVIQSDGMRIKQVISNLLDNALKFTEEGEVEVGVEHKGDYCQFFVRDTGIGIPEDKQELIFDRFRKLEDNIDKLYRGTGLGLAICKKITEHLHGNIWVESEENEYSTFYFSVPIGIRVKEPQKPELIEDTSKMLLSGRHVIVAEDEKDNYILLETILKKNGASVAWAKTGVEALEMVQSAHFDLGIIDIMMPEMDGFEFMNQLKAKGIKAPPMIAHTAFTIGNNREKFLEKGFTSHLFKPFRPVALVQLIHRILSR